MKNSQNTLDNMNKASYTGGTGLRTQRQLVEPINVTAKIPFTNKISFCLRWCGTLVTRSGLTSCKFLKHHRELFSLKKEQGSTNETTRPKGIQMEADQHVSLRTLLVAGGVA